jgi:signal transduction histidine kinase
MIRSSQAAEIDESLLVLTDGIENGTRRLRELVEDLVDVSIIELKMLTLSFQEVLLHQILDALEDDVEPFVRQRGQRLVIERDFVPTEPIYADPQRLLQVLYKVVSNAIKYTPDGGTITVAGRVLPGFLDLTVADTGVGIAASRLNTIFDAFSSGGDVSLHSSGKVKFKGSGPGLGLPISKGIIEAHGGSIWVQSPGYNEQTYPGSTFHIMIPLRASPPEGVSTWATFDAYDD